MYNVVVKRWNVIKQNNLYDNCSDDQEIIFLISFKILKWLEAVVCLDEFAVFRFCVQQSIPAFQKTSFFYNLLQYYNCGF